MSWAAHRVVEHLSEEMKPFRDDLRPMAERPARGASAGPITEEPRPSEPAGSHAQRADCCLLPSRLPRLVRRRDHPPPPKPGAADRAARRRVSGPIGPLPAETASRYVHCHATGYVSGYVRGTTHRHVAHTVCRYVYRHAMRYVGAYVWSTPHRYAAHTVRRYVCNVVCRYVVGYVGGHLSQQRGPHARRQVTGGLRGCVRHYASPQIPGYVWRPLWPHRGG